MLTNVLNLNDSNDGNRIKQGDLSIMRYILTDSNDDDLEIKDKPAKAYLINSKGVQYIYETKVNKEKSSYVVDLVIDKILPSDVYTLEIWVDNQYCFPSDSKTKIQVEESAIGMGFINVETHDLWKELTEYAIQHGYLKQTEVKGDSSDFVVSDKAPEDTSKIWIDTNGGQE